MGKRTAEAGYQNAKIIVDGEYVSGVGGGVWQVSTTLYNAALKAGLEAIEVHAHSLQVGYVAPSRDAMVSTGYDLKLYNPYAQAVYLCAKCFQGSIKNSFYGKNAGDRYELFSNILAKIPPPAPIVKDGEEEMILREERAGIKSEMFLEQYRGERLLSRRRLRTEEYRPIQGIVVKKVVDTTNKMRSNDCVF